MKVSRDKNGWYVYTVVIPPNPQNWWLWNVYDDDDISKEWGELLPDTLQPGSELKKMRYERNPGHFTMYFVPKRSK